ncbi:MAG: glutaredoxin domain-containing protein [Patescibacteria group bacterium]|jgi:glutaredoxin
MHIVLLGKTDCGQCEYAKRELEKRIIKFEYIPLDDNENWRENGSIEAMAAVAFASLDFTHPPLFVIGNNAYEWVQAMKVMTGENVKPIPICENGVCRI